MTRQGLFVGLVTLDVSYLAAGVPSPNQKLVAVDGTIAAGGPATNAAIAYRYLGNRATICGVVGVHPIGHLILAELERYQVQLQDLDPTRADPLPISSIIVSQGSGDRAVISLNATKSQIGDRSLPPDLLRDINIVLIDGHQMAVGTRVVQLANAKNIPVAIDGGSWKPGWENLLPFVDYAICSANFYPPHCCERQQVITYLADLGIERIAITRGNLPIQYFDRGKSGTIPVPQIQAVDTLGAGDIFHGAFCHYILEQEFTDALAAAAQIAANSCQHFGTRRWMHGTNDWGKG